MYPVQHGSFASTWIAACCLPNPAPPCQRTIDGFCHLVRVGVRYASTPVKTLVCNQDNQPFLSWCTAWVVTLTPSQSSRVGQVSCVLLTYLFSSQLTFDLMATSLSEYSYHGRPKALVLKGFATVCATNCFCQAKKVPVINRK